jgi:hypothetical protein
MATRQVIGTIRTGGGVPVAGAKLLFNLKRKGAYDAAAQYLESTVEAETDLTGNFEVDLFPTSLSIESCKWQVTFPDGWTRLFELPAGDTPIELSTCLGLTAEPNTTGTATLCQNLVNTHAAVIASTSVLGHIKVDGTTIVVNPLTGVASAVGGLGSGDMQKSVYDPDEDGVVTAAASVPWTGVTGKPSTFAPAAHTHAISDVTGLSIALDLKADLDGGGKILASQIPAIAISEWLGTVANQAAMLALVGQRGDFCTRLDAGAVYILIADDPTQLSSWLLWPYPAAPVVSVNGQTGAVTIAANLTGTPSASNYVVTNSLGTGFTIPAAGGGNAGLMAGADAIKLGRLTVDADKGVWVGTGTPQNNYAVAVGYNATIHASALVSTAIGHSVSIGASGGASVCVGHGISINGFGTGEHIVIGPYSSANGRGNIVIGLSSGAAGTEQYVFGGRNNSGIVLNHTAVFVFSNSGTTFGTGDLSAQTGKIARSWITSITSVQERVMGGTEYAWVDSTDATARAEGHAFVGDAAATNRRRSCFRWGTDGTQPLFAVLGANPAARQTLPAAATDAATTQALANSLRTLAINFGFAQ